MNHNVYLSMSHTYVFQTLQSKITSAFHSLNPFICSRSGHATHVNNKQPTCSWSAAQPPVSLGTKGDRQWSKMIWQRCGVWAGSFIHNNNNNYNNGLNLYSAFHRTQGHLYSSSWLMNEMQVVEWVGSRWAKNRHWQTHTHTHTHRQSIQKQSKHCS